MSKESIHLARSRSARESAEKLSSINSLVFVLSVIGAVIFLISGLGNSNGSSIAIGVAVFIVSLLMWRFVETFARHIIALHPDKD